VSVHPPSRSPHAIQVYGCGGLVFTLIALAMLYQAIVGELVPAYRLHNVYVPTTALVIETATDIYRGSRGSEQYRPRVRLRYEAAGELREVWQELNAAEPYSAREEADERLRAHPIGHESAAWYDPDHPELLVFSIESSYRSGLFQVGAALSILALLFGVPLNLLIGRARSDWHRRRATGQVIGGEVRPVTVFDQPAFRPVLFVEYDREGEIHRGTIGGEVHEDRALAEAEMASLLAAYPAGVERTLWYDRRDREEPTFVPPLGILAVLVSVVRILLEPLRGAVHVIREWLTRPRAVEPASSPSSRGRVLFVVVALVALALFTRYIVWREYRVLFVYRPTEGKVLVSDVMPRGESGFEPNIRICYWVDGHYYERPAWLGSSPFQSQSHDEARSAAARYPAGSEVVVWYDPDMPHRARIERYILWWLYPLLIPPIWFLALEARRLLRRNR
jgi:hypothetical protein